MVQALVKIDENTNRVLNIVKATHGLKDKGEAIQIVVERYIEEENEPELRPEYLEKLKRIRKEGYSETFNSIGQLRKKIEKR